MGTSQRALRVPGLLAAGVATILGTTGVADAVPAPTEVAAPGVYIVALEAPPPAAGTDRGTARRDALLRAVGNPEVMYRFESALNGFVAELTRAQVKALRSDPAVALVERSTTQRLDSVDSPRFLGAQKAWAAAGGVDDAGKGMLVGVIDSGIWPENPSFAALPNAHAVRPPPDGGCQPGDGWDESDCNTKVVTARYFVDGFGEDRVAPSDFLSPRDRTGHGSHVAAIAAGNHGVEIRVEGQAFGRASGMAPAARIAAYKICWTAPDPSADGCTTADAVAAIDRAVADGVDVITYAASDPDGVESPAVELAFLNASAAGVFVAASAGNLGPGDGTVAHPSPWVTTVGASTHHFFQGAVTLGGRAAYVGAMVSDRAVPRTGIVLGERVAALGSSSDDARLCRAGALDADAVQDKIVVCDRGTIPRVEKSAAVAQAGGAGMVLANLRPDSVDADFHSVPTVHVDVAAAQAIKRYVAETVDPKAAIDPRASDGTAVPQIAPFSSRGPVPVDGGSLLKPDVTAPGVGVLSAVAPPAYGGRPWDLASGTSMSTAHVAGLAAVVMGERPGWTPAMVKSAMSTTADQLAGVSGPRAAGAGQVDAAAVLDPGLALDVRPRAFRAWHAGRTATRNLNLPSIAVGDLTGGSRVVRRVTNVAQRTETYTSTAQGLAGLDVTIRPRTLTLAPGETGRFTLRLDRTTAALEAPVSGSVVWNGISHRARIPVLVTPRIVSAPEQASGSGSSGSVAFEGVAGLDGRLGLDVAGLAGSKPVGLTLEPGDFTPSAPDTDADTARFPVTVAPGAAVLRVELEGRDSDDLDLYLYRGEELVASTTGSGADEVITEVDAEPGDYQVYVTSAVAANRSTTTAQLYTWVVRDRTARNLRAPASIPVGAGETFTVDLSWKRLDPTRRWFGAIRYDGSDELTFVTVR